MNVSELTGAMLDYWVAQCELDKTFDELELKEATNNRWLIADKGDGSVIGVICHGIIDRSKARSELQLPRDVFYYCPSGDWTFGGPLIERERIDIHSERRQDWIITWVARTQLKQVTDVVKCPCYRMEGHTPLVAAMRAYVASKYGETVPEEVK